MIRNCCASLPSVCRQHHACCLTTTAIGFDRCGSSFLTDQFLLLHSDHSILGHLILIVAHRTVSTGTRAAAPPGSATSRSTCRRPAALPSRRPHRRPSRRTAPSRTARSASARRHTGAATGSRRRSARYSYPSAPCILMVVVVVVLIIMEWSYCCYLRQPSHQQL